MGNRKSVLIINPLSSQKYLSDELAKNNINSIALFTKHNDEFTNYVRPNPDYFNEQIYVSQNSSIEEIVAKIPKVDFDFILNGTDESLMITEAIINRIKPELSNSNALIESRTNKFSMQEQFKLSGLPYIKQIRFDFSEIDKLDEANLWFPCILKPLLGAASIGVFLCNNLKELKENMTKANKLLTLMSESINSYIIQEVIKGQELFVDTFSYNGKHYVSAVHTIHKEKIGDNVACYRYEVLIDSKEIWDGAAQLVLSALDACGFKNGFNHTELFLLADGSFRVLEINPRISGAKGMPNKLTGLQSLNTQTDLLYKCINEGILGNSLFENVRGYAKLLYLYNFTDNLTFDIGLSLNTRLTLESKADIIMCSDIGSVPIKIKDLTNVDAMVLLYHDDKKVVERDAKKIFDLEAKGVLFSF